MCTRRNAVYLAVTDEAISNSEARERHTEWLKLEKIKGECSAGDPVDEMKTTTTAQLFMRLDGLTLHGR